MRSGLFTAFVVSSFAISAFAHGGRLPFAFWGGFPRSVVPCQQALSLAVRRCATSKLRLQLRCAASPEACTPEHVRDQKRAIELAALDLIARSCSDRATVQLGFLGVIEAQADASNVCAKVDQQLSPFTLPPAIEESATGSCTTFLAHASLKLLRQANSIWQHTFDRIATRNVSPTRKSQMLEQARQRIARATNKLHQLANARCPAASMQTNLQTFLTESLSAAARASECLAGAAYVQDAVHCDPPVSP